MTKKQKILQPEEISPVSKLLNKILEELDKILLGHSSLHKLVLIGIMSRGHILLEGLPGVGKTALVKALGELMRLQFSRIQFTPDLMPADILGTNILHEKDSGKREMVFQPGPVFTNILLADEINRASPKTQSALLEAMQEANVTLFGKTYSLPSPFFVLASQNPIEMEGTYPIPEAQLDRFLFKLTVTGVDKDILHTIISTRRRGIPPKPSWRLSEEELNSIFEVMDKIFLPNAVSEYIARLVSLTHSENESAPSLIKQYISYGASPRAAIAISETARAAALIAGRPTVGFEDVKQVVYPVLNHRLILNYKAKIDNISCRSIVDDLLKNVPETGIKIPEDISIS